MPKVFQVDELIAPLCKYSQGVFEERNHDQETADSWEVSGESVSSIPAAQ